MSHRGTLQTIQFPKLLPLLVSRYEQGRLVPFIGAGMSAPKLSLWKQFVTNLEREASIKHPSHPDLDIRAQRAATRIRNTRGQACWLQSLGKALEGRNFKSGMPPQTAALARIYWPLVVSTNYDDLLYTACRHNAAGGLHPDVMGRSPADCKRIISSLSSPFDRELIWHIQGFLGGQAPPCQEAKPIEPKERLAGLQAELVVGHSEYRSVTNTAVHFRRCFGEVFRSRSFLFMGSGLTEYYFLNLFGEVLELCGPSTVPHFAFAQRGQVDARFLAEQMNILVCEYDSPERVREWLEKLKECIESPAAGAARWSFNVRSRMDLEIVTSAQGLQAAPGDAMAWVVRRGENGCVQMCEFPSATDLAESKLAGVTFPAGRHVVRAGKSDYYAVTASDSGGLDAAEKASVFSAGEELLDTVLKDGYRTLHLHLASGGGSVPPVYGFIESVRTFGRWKRAGGPLKLILHAGPQVILNLTSHQIEISELLTSELTRFWTLVYCDGSREPVRRVLYYHAATTRLSQVLEDLGVPSQEDWFLSICPSPQHDGTVPKERRSTRYLAGKTLLETGVVFGSILTFQRESAGECVAQAVGAD